MSITTIYNLQLNIIQTKWKLFTKDNLKFQAWLSLAEEVDRETLKVSKLKNVLRHFVRLCYLFYVLKHKK